MNNFFDLPVVVNEIGQQVCFCAFHDHSWSRDLIKFFLYTTGVIVTSVLVTSSC